MIAKFFLSVTLSLLSSMNANEPVQQEEEAYETLIKESDLVLICKPTKVVPLERNAEVERLEEQWGVEISRLETQMEVVGCLKGEAADKISFEHFRFERILFGKNFPFLVRFRLDRGLTLRIIDNEYGESSTKETSISNSGVYLCFFKVEDGRLLPVTGHRDAASSFYELNSPLLLGSDSAEADRIRQKIRK